MELRGHTSRVLHLALSPDGTTIASAAADETLRFWRVFETRNKKSAGGKLQNLSGSLIYLDPFIPFTFSLRTFSPKGLLVEEEISFFLGQSWYSGLNLYSTCLQTLAY